MYIACKSVWSNVQTFANRWWSKAICRGFWHKFLKPIIDVVRSHKPPRGVGKIRAGARARYVIQRNPSHTKAFRSLRSLPRRMCDQLTQARACSNNAGSRGRADYTVSPISCDLLLNNLIQSVRLQVYQGIWEIWYILHDFLTFAEIPDYTWCLGEFGYVARYDLSTNGGNGV